MNGLELPTTSGRRRRVPKRGVLAAVTGLVAIALALLMIGGVGASVNGAAFTTDNPSGGTAACLNGPPDHTTPSVNCNIYQAKPDVWINGGPSNGHNHLTDGDYFFAVLEPGGQPDPNDGGAKNLSDTGLSGGTNDTCGDAYANRTFTVSDGHVSAYTGDGTDYYDGTPDQASPDPCTGSGGADPHQLDILNGDALGNLIQLWPYDTTGNPGGVYILAICSLASYPVAPHDCKYDAFKVRPAGCTDDCGPPPAADLFGSKSAVPDYTRE